MRVLDGKHCRYPEKSKIGTYSKELEISYIDSPTITNPNTVKNGKVRSNPEAKKEP